VTARAVSSTGTMPVHLELVEEVLFVVMQPLSAYGPPPP
jgi:hypothetical protein